MVIYYAGAVFQAANPSGTHTRDVTVVTGSPLPQPHSSVPWGYPYVWSLPQRPRGQRSSFMSPIHRGASSTLVQVM